MKRFWIYIMYIILLLSTRPVTVLAAEPATDAGITPASEPDPNENEGEWEGEDDVPEITVIWNADLFLQARTLECGDEEGRSDLLDTLSQQFESIGGWTADNEYEAELVLDKIDASDLDLSTPGTYTIVIRLKLSDEYSSDFYISDETRTLHLSVTVTAPDKLTLTYSKTMDTYIQYLVSPSGDENPVLRYAVTEPDTEPAEADWTSEIPNGFCTYSQNGVRIYRSMLDPEKYYYLKVCRDDLTSNVVKLIPPTDNSINNGMGGDRDGSDTNDTTLDKPLVQTPPTNSGSSSSSDSDRSSYGGSSSEGKSDSSGGQSSQTAASASQASQDAVSAPQTESATSTVYERFDNSTLTISGSRLRMMLASDTEIIPFGWNGISLEMPASFIETLAPSDTDMFSLTLTHEDKLAFSVFLTVSGTEIKELPSSLIRIPAGSPEGVYSLLRSGETLPTNVSYENNCAVFTITRTGRYMLKDVPEVPMDRETPNLQEETTSSKNESDGHTTSSGTDKTPKTQDVTGAISSADTGSIIAPATSDEASASTSPETESSPALSSGKENTPPAPTLPEALPAAAAGTVSFSASIYWLWRKHR